MFIKQISVFLENRKGRLSGLTRTLAENNIDLVALSIADTADYGILRAIVNRTEDAERVLKAAGYTISTTEVLGVEVPDSPGGLAKVLEILTKGDISVEYMYSFVRTQGRNALIMFKVNPLDRAQELLCQNGITLVTRQQVEEL